MPCTSCYCAAEGCYWYYEPEGDLPQLIAEHQAAVVLAPLEAQGWAQGREERIMRMESFATPHGPGIRSVWYRRRVTEWEQV